MPAEIRTRATLDWTAETDLPSQQAPDVGGRGAIHVLQSSVASTDEPIKVDWEATRLFPPTLSSPLRLSESQLEMLALLTPDRQL